MKSKLRMLIASVMASMLLFIAPLSLAAGSTITGSLSVKRLNNVGVSSIGRLISAVFNVAILVAVIFVFGMMILGGYGWLTAGGDKSKVEEARTRITNALVGLAIVATAWALISVVGQFFGVSLNSLTLPTATGSNTAGDDTSGGL